MLDASMSPSDDNIVKVNLKKNKQKCTVKIEYF